MASSTGEVPTDADAAAADVAAKGTPAAATVTDTVEASPIISPPKGQSLAGALAAESSPETVVEEEEEPLLLPKLPQSWPNYQER